MLITNFPHQSFLENFASILPSWNSIIFLHRYNPIPIPIPEDFPVKYLSNIELISASLNHLQLSSTFMHMLLLFASAENDIFGFSLSTNLIALLIKLSITCLNCTLSISILPISFSI